MSRFDLSILIAHLPNRAAFLQRLLESLPQEDSPYFRDFEVLVDDREEIIIENDYGDYVPKKITTGEKRNALLQRAEGKYVAFIDDDDLITEHYFPGVFEGIKNNVDCCSLRGIITDDGQNPRTFEHSLTHNHWETVRRGGKEYYLRTPTPINCIKASIAKNISFPDKTIGEDHEWSMNLQRSGMLKLEHWIEEPIYLYLCRSKK